MSTSLVRECTPANSFQTIACGTSDSVHTLASLCTGRDACKVSSEQLMRLTSHKQCCVIPTLSTDVFDVAEDSIFAVGVSDLRAHTADTCTSSSKASRWLIADNRLVGPYMCRPLEMGFDATIEQIGMHVFLVTQSASTLRSLNDIMGVATPTLHPDDEVLMNERLSTLAFCSQHRSDMALTIAHYLVCHPQVRYVSYPGLSEDTQHERARSVLDHGSGPLVAFGTRSDAMLTIDGISCKTSLIGGISQQDTHVSECCTTLQPGTKPHTWLIHCGLETPLDIVARLEQCLSTQANCG